MSSRYFQFIDEFFIQNQHECDITQTENQNTAEDHHQGRDSYTQIPETLSNNFRITYVSQYSNENSNELHEVTVRLCR